MNDLKPLALQGRSKTEVNIGLRQVNDIVGAQPLQATDCVFEMTLVHALIHPCQQRCSDRALEGPAEYLLTSAFGRKQHRRSRTQSRQVGGRNAPAAALPELLSN